MLDPGVTHGLAVEIPGLVFAYRFREGAAERLDSSEAARALHEPGTWLWLHLSLAEQGARDFIAQSDIPERARALLLSDDDHLRLEPIAGGVAGVFADFLRDMDGETRGIGRLRFALTDTLVISGRWSALGGISRTLKALDEGARFPHAVALLEAIVDHFADATASVAEDLADQLDAIEDRVLEERTSDERRSLGPVRRTAVRLHRQLASLRVLFRRWGGPAGGELPSRLGRPPPGWHSGSTVSTSKSSRCRTAPSCCRTRSRRRSPPTPTATCLHSPWPPPSFCRPHWWSACSA